MKQYLDLAKAVKERGTYKGPAREGMPGTTSLFGYQFRHDLSEGFPILTTKKVSFKNIVYELLWFLRGDTNIKYLVDKGCDIWNEDAYNYYLKQCKAPRNIQNPVTFDDFEEIIKRESITGLKELSHDHFNSNYTFGDCGKQYGWLWRKWEALTDDGLGNSYPLGNKNCGYIDQLKDVINLLKTNPLSRRIILSAWNPTTLDDMALNACHALVQFNCRPLTEEQKEIWRLQAPAALIYKTNPETGFTEINHDVVPQHYLDCQMYQRSADLFLGVPYNISSYALLTYMLAEMNNMIPGEFIHTFGDVHIYDDHMDKIDLQLTREPHPLPTLDLSEWLKQSLKEKDIDEWIKDVDYSAFGLNNYVSHPGIKAKLSTGLK